MKSVLHIALIAPGGYSAKPFMDAFLNNGFSEYRAFDYQLNRFNTDKETMQRMLIKEAQDMKPDIVFAQVQGSDVIDLETWQALSKIAFTVNYSFDIRSHSQTQWMYNLAGVIGLVCFSNQDDVEECKRYGHNNCMVLQSSADPEVYKPAEGIERKGIVFIGNNFANTNIEFPLSKERVEMVEFLQKEFPEQFTVYGNNWPGSKLVMQKEEVEILQSSAIVINHNNFDAESYVSDRIWRTMLCGALCLTKYFKGVEAMLPVDTADWWNTLDQLKEEINYYLSNPDRAKEIGEEGRRYCLTNHTWTARIKEMMAFIQQNLMDINAYSVPVDLNADACIKAGAHVIGGVIPQAFDEYLTGKQCDCGKLFLKWEECGCGDKKFQTRWTENV